MSSSYYGEPLEDSQAESFRQEAIRMGYPDTRPRRPTPIQPPSEQPKRSAPGVDVGSLFSSIGEGIGNLLGTSDSAKRAAAEENRKQVEFAAQREEIRKKLNLPVPRGGLGMLGQHVILERERQGLTNEVAKLNAAIEESNRKEKEYLQQVGGPLVNGHSSNSFTQPGPSVVHHAPVHPSILQHQRDEIRRMEQIDKPIQPIDPLYDTFKTIFPGHPLATAEKIGSTISAGIHGIKKVFDKATEVGQRKDEELDYIRFPQ